jgi:hypothetical protein
MWIATPSSQWTCTTYSLPVSRRTRVKTRVTGRQFMNFSRFSAVFGHYRLGKGQKLAPEAPPAGNFRVFIQSGVESHLQAR